MQCSAVQGGAVGGGGGGKLGELFKTAEKKSDGKKSGPTGNNGRTWSEEDSLWIG